VEPHLDVLRLVVAALRGSIEVADVGALKR